MVDVVKVSSQFYANNLSDVPAFIGNTTEITVHQPANLSGVDDRYSIITTQALPGTVTMATGFLIPLSRRYRILANMTPPRAYANSTVTLGSNRITFVCGNYNVAVYKISYGQASLPLFNFPLSPVNSETGQVFASNSGTIASGDALTDFSTYSFYEVEVELSAGDFIYFNLNFGLYPSPNNGSLTFRGDTGYKPKVYASISEISDI